MSWFLALGLAAALMAVVAITGTQPRGTRPVAHTRLMGVGRGALVVLAVIVAYMAFRMRASG